MWPGFLLMLIPGMQMGKLMYGGNQKSVRVKIVINRDAVTFPCIRRTVIAKFGTAVARNFKLAFKVVNPAANERGSIGRKIPF
jgi:hypothetical protein